MPCDMPRRASTAGQQGQQPMTYGALIAHVALLLGALQCPAARRQWLLPPAASRWSMPPSPPSYSAISSRQGPHLSTAIVPGCLLPASSVMHPKTKPTGGFHAEFDAAARADNAPYVASSLAAHSARNIASKVPRRDALQVSKLIFSGIAGGVNPSNNIGELSLASAAALPLQVRGLA